jgi:hypothetical protein
LPRAAAGSYWRPCVRGIRRDANGGRHDTSTGTVTLSNSGINSNTNAINGQTRSYGSNRISANSSDGTPPIPVGSLSGENGLR